MSVLGDPERLRAGDPQGMHRHIEGLWQQLADAARTAREIRLRETPAGIDSVIVLGMGGSAIGGEIAAACLADRVEFPCQVVRDYAVPAFCGPRTLAFVSSYSGNTEETLSAYRGAAALGAHVVCCTTGGELARLAKADGRDVVPIPSGLPPRAAVGYGVVPLLVILARLNLAPDPDEEIGLAVLELRARAADWGLGAGPDVNEAKRLALWLEGSVPVICGSAPRTSVVAGRWCAQFAENAKLVAHRQELPEMNHNEIVGWSGTRPLGGRARIVLLRDVEDHPRVATRFELTRRAIELAPVETRDASSSGGGRLARIMSLVLLGDFVSLYLAALGGVDPTPVVPIETLKRALAGA